jgi:hypothetical protein
MHQVTLTTKSRNISAIENQNYHALHYLYTASAICGTKTEPWNEYCVDTYAACQITLTFPIKLPTSLLMREVYMGEISEVGWLSSCVLYTCCYFWLPKSWLHPSVPFDLLHKHVVPVLIFLQDTLWGCVCVHKATRLAICLFHIHSFCHIHRECYRCICGFLFV